VGVEPLVLAVVRAHGTAWPAAPFCEGFAMALSLNTLLLQRVLAEPAWRERLSDIDRRALTPLFWSNVNPYGRFRLDM
jgi:Tn3 transposase DDE domain-containing protein